LSSKEICSQRLFGAPWALWRFTSAAKGFVSQLRLNLMALLPFKCMGKKQGFLLMWHF
jgi:hypothetical protein